MSVNTVSSLSLESPTCGCTAGECTTCGAPNQPCCEGGACAYTQGVCAADGCLCEGPPDGKVCTP